MKKDFFIDEHDIVITSGKGGDGSMTFRREKYVEKGGPCGGIGGKGGSVYFQGDKQLQSLHHLKDIHSLKAEDGSSGAKNQRTGKDGQDVIIYLPLGTTIFHADTGEFLGEILDDKTKILIARGGFGGKGNASFKSSRRRTPRYSENGTPCEVISVHLDLKLISDVAVVGLPNSGKSTLLKSMTRADPRIGDYPFTTLSPNMGALKTALGEKILMIDVPGLIKDASRGRGMGISFLRHIERSSMLLYLVDVSKETPVEDFITVQDEIVNYHTCMSEKPFLIVLNKIDLLSGDDIKNIQAQFKELNISFCKDIVSVSAKTCDGLDTLYNAIKKYLPRNESFYTSKEYKKYTYKKPSPIHIEKKNDVFIISGDYVKNKMERINWDSPESLERFWNYLKKTGIKDMLEEKGLKSGDTIKCYFKEWIYA